MNKKFLSLALLMLLITVFTLACGASTTRIMPVPADKIALSPNPDYDPSEDDISARYIVHLPGENYDTLTDTLDTSTTIPEGKVGIYGSHILQPGLYVKYPTRDVQIEDALSVPIGSIATFPNGKSFTAGNYRDVSAKGVKFDPAAQIDNLHFGVRRKNDGTYEILQQGLYPNVPAQEVKIFPSGEVRYRLLNGTLYNSGTQSFPEAACQSAIPCEFPMDNVTLSGTGIKAVITLDAIFSFDQSEKFAARLWELNTPETAVQNYLATPLRASRGAFSAMTYEQISSDEGRATAEKVLLDRVKSVSLGQPISPNLIRIRSIVLGSQEFQNQVQEQQAAIEKARTDKTLAEEQGKAIDAQNANEAKQNDFRRQQLLLDAQNQRDRNAAILQAFKDADWRLLWVLIQGGKIEPTLSTDGNNIVPAVVPTPTP